MSKTLVRLQTEYEDKSTQLKTAQKQLRSLQKKNVTRREQTAKCKIEKQMKTINQIALEKSRLEQSLDEKDMEVQELKDALDDSLTSLDNSPVDSALFDIKIDILRK